MTTLVISNPTAARARRHLEALRSALSEPAASHHVTASAAEMVALIGHDRWQHRDVLVINGGDGTVQQALTALMRHCPPERLPLVACLPGGTTNMTAYDLNRHRRISDCLTTLRRSHHTGTDGVVAAERAAVRVSPRPGATAAGRCGLFFGIGSIVQGIEYFHERLRHNGALYELGAGAALVRTVWGMARRQPPFANPLAVRLDMAPATAAGAGSFACAGNALVRLFLATTLDRLFLGIRPWWGSGTGGLKCTLVEARAPALVARIPRLLRGRPDSRMAPEHGYHSGRLEAFGLEFRGSYTLDGELFAHTDDTIDVAATVSFRFLSL